MVSNPVSTGEPEDERLIEAARRAEIEVLDAGPGQSELGQLEVSPHTAVMPSTQLSFEKEGEPILEGEAVDIGHGELLIESGGHAGELELVQAIDGLLRQHGLVSGVVCGQVVVRSAYVAVIGRERERGLLFERDLIESFLENGLHRAVGERADRMCAGARGFQTRGRVAVAETKQTEAGAIALLGMTTRFQDALDHEAGVRAGLLPPADQA